jgi:hypothetical protein
MIPYRISETIHPIKKKEKENVTCFIILSMPSYARYAKPENVKKQQQEDKESLEKMPNSNP